MKYIVLIFTIFFATACLAQKRWKNFSITGDSIAYQYDKESIKKIQPDHYTVWMRDFPFGDSSLTLERKRQYILNDSDAKFLTYAASESRIEINCQENKFRFLQTIDYNEGKKIILYTDYEDMGVIKWSPVIPESIFEILLKKICNNGIK